MQIDFYRTRCLLKEKLNFNRLSLANFSCLKLGNLNTKADFEEVFKAFNNMNKVGCGNPTEHLDTNIWNMEI